MSGLLALNAIAANGDGLHPALLALLQQRQAMQRAGALVEELALRRADPHIQAGPHPQGVAPRTLPPEVVRLVHPGAFGRRRQAATK